MEIKIDIILLMKSPDESLIKKVINLLKDESSNDNDTSIIESTFFMHESHCHRITVVDSKRESHGECFISLIRRTSVTY